MEAKKRMLEHGMFLRDVPVGMDWLDTDGKVKTMCGLCKLVVDDKSKDIMNKLFERDEFILHLSTHTPEELRKGMLDK